MNNNDEKNGLKTKVFYISVEFTFLGMLKTVLLAADKTRKDVSKMPCLS